VHSRAWNLFEVAIFAVFPDGDGTAVDAGVRQRADRVQRLAIRPGRYFAPSHVPLNLRNEGSKYVSMAMLAMTLQAPTNVSYDAMSLKREGFTMRVDDVAGNIQQALPRLGTHTPRCRTPWTASRPAPS